MNGAGGQFSSLGDLIKFMQTLLNPDRSESLIPREVVREWLRPVQPMFDDITEMGAPWEILKMKNKWGKVQRLYEKCSVSFVLLWLVVYPTFLQGDNLRAIIPRLRSTLLRGMELSYS